MIGFLMCKVKSTMISWLASSMFGVCCCWGERLHNTIQEFLAALYLSECKDGSQTTIELSSKPYMLNLFRFYCGLTSFDQSYIFCYLNIPHRYNFLFAIQCAFESQQESTCEALMEAAEGIAFDCHLNSSDLAAIEYVICTSSTPLRTLSLVQHCTDGDGVKRILTSIVNRKLELLSSLTLSCISLGSVGMQVVTERLQYCCSLRTLDLSQNHLHSDDIAGLVQELKHCRRLQGVNLSFNLIHDDIVRSSEEWQQLDGLNLSYNKLSSSEIFDLVCRLKSMITTLYLQGNSCITPKQLLALADELNYLSDLIRHLHLQISERDQSELVQTRRDATFTYPKRMKMRRLSFQGYEPHPEVKDFNTQLFDKFVVVNIWINPWRSATEQMTSELKTSKQKTSEQKTSEQKRMVINVVIYC